MGADYSFRNLNKEDFAVAWMYYMGMSSRERDVDVDDEFEKYTNYNGNVYGCPCYDVTKAADVGRCNVHCWECWNGVINYCADVCEFWKVV